MPRRNGVRSNGVRLNGVRSNGVCQNGVCQNGVCWSSTCRKGVCCGGLRQDALGTPGMSSVSLDILSSFAARGLCFVRPSFVCRLLLRSVLCVSRTPVSRLSHTSLIRVSRGSCATLLHTCNKTGRRPLATNFSWSSHLIAAFGRRTWSLHLVVAFGRRIWSPHFRIVVISGTARVFSVFRGAGKG